jgi:hypothetical protein
MVRTQRNPDYFAMVALIIGRELAPALNDGSGRPSTPFLHLHSIVHAVPARQGTLQEQSLVRRLESGVRYRGR